MATTVERLQIEMDLISQGVNKELLDMVRAVKAFEREAKGAARPAKQFRDGLDDLEGPAKRATKSVTGLTSSIRSMARVSRDIREVSRPFVAMGRAVIGVSSDMVQHMAELETAFVSVTKTVDETATKSYRDIRRELKLLGTEVPIATEELFELGGVAGQLGVQADDLAEFVEVAAKLGIATDLSAEKAATGLAKLSAVMGTTHEEATAFGSVMVALGNNMPTTESQILLTAQRMSGLAKTIGLTTPELMAFSAATSSLGMSPQLASGAFQRVFLEINTAVRSGTKDLAAYAAVAQMSAEDFARQWTDAPAEAIQSFLGGLNVFIETGGDVNTLFEELGLKGTRNLQVMTRAAGGYQQFAQALGLATGEMAKFTNGQEAQSALNIEAEKQAQTLAGTYQRLKNAVSGVVDDLGESGLSGSLQKVVAFVLDNVNEFREWIQTSEDFQYALERVDSFIDNTLIPQLSKAFGGIAEIWTDETKTFEQKVEETLKAAGKAAGDAMIDALAAAISAGKGPVGNAVQDLMFEVVKSPLTGWKRLFSGDLIEATMSDAAYDQYMLDQVKDTASADGNLLEGPKSGFLALLHGREWVIPDNPGQNPYEELARLRGDKLPGFAMGKAPEDIRSFGTPEEWREAYLEQMLNDFNLLAIRSAQATGGLDFSFGGGPLGGGLQDLRADFYGEAKPPKSMQEFADSLDLASEELARLPGITGDVRDQMMKNLQGLEGPMQDSLRQLVASIPTKEITPQMLRESEDFQEFLDSLPDAEQGEVLKALTKQQEEILEGQNAEFDEWLGSFSKARDDLEQAAQGGFPGAGSSDPRDDAMAAITAANAAELARLTDMVQSARGVSTGQTVDVQAASELLYGLGFGSAGTGKGVIRSDGPNSQAEAIADVLRRASRGEFLDIKQIDFQGLFGNVLSDNLIRSIVDENVSQANRQGAGTGSGIDYFVQNQRFIEETVRELAQLALGADGLRQAQMDQALSFRDATSQLDVFRERMDLLTDSVGKQVEATARHIDMSKSAALELERANAATRELGRSTGNPLVDLIARGGPGNPLAALIAGAAGNGAGSPGAGIAGNVNTLLQGPGFKGGTLELHVNLNSRTLARAQVEETARRRRVNVSVGG